MSINKQISLEEERIIIKTLISELKSEGDINEKIKYILWEDAFDIPKTMKLLWRHEITLDDALARIKSLSGLSSVSPIEFLLWIYYKSLSTSLKLNNPEKEEIKKVVTKHKDNINSILLEIHTLALKKTWALNLIEEKKDGWYESIGQWDKENIDIIKRIITIHQAWFLAPILENSRFISIVAELKNDWLEKIIELWEIGWLELLKENETLSTITNNTENLIILISIYNKWLFGLLLDINSIHLYDLVMIEDIDIINRENIQQHQGSKLSLNELEDIVPALINN